LIFIYLKKRAGLISRETLKNYIIISGDGIKAKIPTDKLHIIFEPNNIKKTTKQDLQIRDIFIDNINKIIDMVKEEY